MPKKEIVSTDKAPRPIAPISQATRFGQLVFTAGMGGRDPKTGQLAGPDVQSQARQIFENMNAVLEAAGTSLANVLKLTCFLSDINDMKAFNEVFTSYFPDNRPARTGVQVAKLGAGMVVEIEAIACIPD